MLEDDVELFVVVPAEFAVLLGTTALDALPVPAAGAAASAPVIPTKLATLVASAILRPRCAR